MQSIYYRCVKLSIPIISIIIFLPSCIKKVNEPEKLGLLKLSYQVNFLTDPSPSYQTAIWLEDINGNYLKTLFASEWLSLGGYTIRPYICQEWHTISNWDQVSKSEIFAVTGATPSVGVNELVTDCRTENLSHGIYCYKIETHYVDKYNVLYSGSIEIGNKQVSDTAQITYIPDKYPDAADTDVISYVCADYYFDE